MMKGKSNQDIRKIYAAIINAIAAFGIILAAGCTGVSSPNPVTTPPVTANPATSVLIEAAPQFYSPLMSSTPGVGLTTNATGFNATDAVFEWNASYGKLLQWNAPGYVVQEKGSSAVSHGDKIYWSFYEFPASTKEPVVITVTAKEM